MPVCMPVKFLSAQFAMRTIIVRMSSVEGQLQRMKYCAVVVIVLASLSLGPASCQSDCASPTESDLDDVISQSIPTGDSPQTPTVDVRDFHPVCLAHSEERDRYRYVSVVVQYTCTGNVNCPSGTAVEQFDSQCSGGTWSHSVLSDVDNTRTDNPTANFGTSTREDCALCLSPATASGFRLETDNITHCVECHSDCNEGLMRCYGLQASQCCQYYTHDNTCTDACTSPLISNAAFECVCPGFFNLPNCSVCGLDCENGGTPEQVNCTECECPANFSGYNCSEDIDECNSMPCQNEATCENSYGSFMCICPEGYTGTLCDEDIDECVDMPCQNGATCLNTNGSFTCTCAVGYENYKVNEDGKCVCADGFVEDKKTCLQVSRTTGDNTDRTLIGIIVPSIIGFLFIVVLVTLIIIAIVVSLRRQVRTNYNVMKGKDLKGNITENPLFVRPETLEDTGGGVGDGAPESALNESTTL